MTQRIWRVLVTEDAAEHASNIDAWWRQHRPAAVTLFRDEFEKTVRRLASRPMAGAEYRTAASGRLRRILLRRTRYHIYYTIDPQRHVVLVRAVWHAARGRPPTIP